MKLFLIALVMLPGFALSQSARPVDSKITTVTVFLNRAQITRQAQTTLPAGKSLVVLSGLSPDLDPQSISVAGKGRFLILGIGHHLNFLAERAPSKLLKTLQDSPPRATRHSTARRPAGVRAPFARSSTTSATLGSRPSTNASG